VITGLQIRAARGFLAWDRRDLAKKAVVTIYTVGHAVKLFLCEPSGHAGANVGARGARLTMVQVGTRPPTNIHAWPPHPSSGGSERG
jgi:hypothetical protein